MQLDHMATNTTISAENKLTINTIGLADNKYNIFSS